MVQLDNMQLLTIEDLKRPRKTTKSKTPISFTPTVEEKMREIRIKQEMKNRQMDVGLYSEKLREFTVQLHNELEKILGLSKTA